MTTNVEVLLLFETGYLEVPEAVVGANALREILEHHLELLARQDEALGRLALDVVVLAVVRQRVIFRLLPLESVALRGRVGHIETLGVQHLGTDRLEI